MAAAVSNQRSRGAVKSTCRLGMPSVRICGRRKSNSESAQPHEIFAIFPTTGVVRMPPPIATGTDDKVSAEESMTSQLAETAQASLARRARCLCPRTLGRGRNGSGFPKPADPHHRALRRRRARATPERACGRAARAELGKPVVIENRGGGGGLNATEAYFKAEPDGHTILVGAIGPLTIIPALKQVSYDVEKDIVPLSTVWRSAQVLAVRPGLGVKTVEEFVAYAKANPNKVTIGSAGVGAVTHLAIEVLKREAKNRR